MKFVINSKTLEGNLFLLNKQVMAKSENEMLTSVCFQMNEKGRLKQIAVNEDGSSIVIGTSVDDHEGSGSFCVKPSILSNAIKGLTAQGITIDCDGTSILLSYEGGKVELPCMKADDFPKVETPNKESGIVNVVSGANFCDGIKRCNHACSNDVLRLKLTSVYVGINENNMQIVALDGKRVVVSKYKHTDGNETSVLLPKRIARLVKDINASEVEIITYNDSSRFDLKFDKYLRVSGYGIAEKYSNYKKMVKCEVEQKAIVSRNSLLNTLSRMAFFCDKSTSKIKLTFTKSCISISTADNENGYEMTESVSTTYDGEETSIGINCNYLSEILKNLSEKNVELKIANPKEPLYIKQDGTDCKVFASVASMILEEKADPDEDDEKQDKQTDSPEPEEEQTEEQEEESAEEQEEEQTEDEPDEDGGE